MQSAAPTRPAAVGQRTSSAAPAAAKTTLMTEIWFGVTAERASAAAQRRAQALPRAAIGRRLDSSIGAIRSSLLRDVTINGGRGGHCAGSLEPFGTKQSFPSPRPAPSIAERAG